MMADSNPPQPENRYLMIELSCAERKCNPCTYPNCQRFVREKGKGKVISSRVFESVPAPEPDKMRQRYVLLELSCAERKCQPCTYPNCQRFEREVVKKKSFKMRVVELSGDNGLKDLLVDRRKDLLSGAQNDVSGGG
ncbi:MAG: hypothetical protein QHH00_07815 [Methanomassiliicoccales archaeon]|jgi:hypothetical protein|nr:hypothetical protein [Methanomassiliicoccales archaeon]